MHRKKLLVLTAIAFSVGISIAATGPRSSTHKNLKVLPKDISDEKLDSIMHTYNKALGVTCDFCHTPFDPKFPDSLDFASDGSTMKEEARKMMRMTIQLNRDYFYYDSMQRPEYLKVVTCNTCHRGDPFPADL